MNAVPGDGLADTLWVPGFHGDDRAAARESVEQRVDATDVVEQEERESGLFLPDFLELLEDRRQVVEDRFGGSGRTGGEDHEPRVASRDELLRERIRDASLVNREGCAVGRVELDAQLCLGDLQKALPLRAHERCERHYDRAEPHQRQERRASVG